MHLIYTETDAWDAYDRQDYSLAAHIWLSLLASAADLASLCRYQLGYTSVLIAQGKYPEATGILEELHESTQDCLYLHQLGYLAWDQGKPQLAKAHFLAEQISLKGKDVFALAANAYWLGTIALEGGMLSVAFHYARRSLEYAQKAEHQIAIACAYRLLGEVREVLKDPEKALDCYTAAQEAGVRSFPDLKQNRENPRLAALQRRLAEKAQRLSDAEYGHQVG